MRYAIQYKGLVLVMVLLAGCCSLMAQEQQEYRMDMSVGKQLTTNAVPGAQYKTVIKKVSQRAVLKSAPQENIRESLGMQVKNNKLPGMQYAGGGGASSSKKSAAKLVAASNAKQALSSDQTAAASKDQQKKAAVLTPAVPNLQEGQKPAEKPVPAAAAKPVGSQEEKKNEQ